MTAMVTEKHSCRLCQSEQLQPALSLAPTPLGDEFVPAGLLGQAQPCYPLDLMLCGECGNVQLRNVVNPDAVYRHYTYTTSVSLGLAEHFQKYADALLAQHPIAPGGMVVEIGSNEGLMLRAFANRGLRVLGVDPAADIARHATRAGTKTLPTYFTAELARQIRAQHGPAGAIVANYVLANIDDFDDVISGVDALLADNGVLVFETSYCLDVVQQALLDTIFHEHLSYFAVAPLAKFFRRHGMEITDVRRVHTKGGSIRVTVRRAGAARPAPAVAELIALEAQAGLDRVETYQSLGNRLDQQKSTLLALLSGWKRQGKTIAAYGAAVGLTTMIYQFELGGYLSFIADDNPQKFNLFSPGLHLPTLPSQALYDRRPDYVILLAWRYADAILKRHEAFIKQGGRFVLPVPEPKII